VLESRPGPIAAVGEPTGASIGVGDSVAADRDLAWQTTVGQIVFLESVLHKPT
jgi:hypothetical protein